MTIQELYHRIGGDYQEVLDRMISEQLITKFLIRFLSDDSYSCVVAALESQNYEEAFRAVHTLKGVCLNMGFGHLFSSSSRLTELLRPGNPTSGDEEIQHLLEKVKADYIELVEMIQHLQEIS